MKRNIRHTILICILIMSGALGLFVNKVLTPKNLSIEEFKDLGVYLREPARNIRDFELINTENLFVNNAISNTVFLIPELKEFDYLLKLIGIWKDEETSGLKKYLHNMINTESEISINLNTIKSINNLVL